MPQQQINARLVPPAVSLQPIDDISVKAHGYGSFRRTIEFPYLGPTPIQDLWHIGQINVFVFHGRDGGDISFLFFG